MKTRKPLLALFLGLLILAAALFALIPQPANAQQICTDPATGQVIPCPPPPREKHTKRPTPVPPSRTPTPTTTPTPTATPVGIPLTGGDAGGAASDGIRGTPAVILHNFSSPSVLSGLGILLLVLILAVRFRGRLFDPQTGLFKRFGLFGHSVNAGNSSGSSEVYGNDSLIGLGGQDSAPIGRNPGIARFWLEPGHRANIAHGSDNLADNWEQHGDVDMNIDGTNTAEQGDTSSSMRKPPEDA